MRFTRLWRLLRLGLALLAAALPLAAAAESDAISLRGVPDQIVLQPGSSRQSIVLLGHPAAALTVSAARLEILPGSGLTAAIKSAPSLPGNGDLAWTIEIAAAEGAAKDAVVVFRLDYKLAPG